MEVRIETRNLNLWYGDFQALKKINLKIFRNKVTSIIGPSGCGKSSFIKTLNRMVDIVEGAKVEGEVLLDGENIYSNQTDIIELRRKIGMVFQKPNPFPKSIWENIAYGPKVHGLKDRKELHLVVRESLKRAALFEEVRDKLSTSALELSGGQQQRLCIARTLAVKPEVILFDEPCSALDPISTAKIEDLIHDLKKRYTIIIVTHNMQQAARVSDFTGVFYLGKLIEFGETNRLFTNPKNEITENYIAGRFG